MMTERGFPEDRTSRIARIEAALDRIYNSGMYTSQTQREIRSIRDLLEGLK